MFETKYSYRGQNTGAMERSSEVKCSRSEAAQEKLTWASFTDGGFLIGLILLGEYNGTVRSTLFIITLAEIKSDTKFRGIKKPIGRCIGEMKLRTFWAARPQSKYSVPAYILGVKVQFRQG